MRRNASSPSGSPSPTTRSSPNVRAARHLRRVHGRRQDQDDWAKAFYNCSDLAKTLDWETFDKKGYHIINAPEDYKPTPSLRWFAEGRACDTPNTGNPKRGTDKAHKLGTYSGKIEFASESLKAHFPDDQERPVSRVHRSWEGHRPSSSRNTRCSSCRRTTLSFHCHYDKHTDWLDDIPVHRIKKDGYAWWPVPVESGRRGCARHPQRRHRAPVTTTARLCFAARSSPSASPPASRTATRRRPSTTRSSRARPLGRQGGA